jgi:hypothetical protein
MVKAGIIAAVVALVLAIGGSLFMGICVPCISIFIGVAAGYLACHYEPAGDNGSAAKSGAIAGAIGGIGALLGQAIGSVITGVTAGPEAGMDMMRQFGWEMPTDVPIPDAYFWIGVVGGGCCIGVFDLLLMAGLGAVGGILWWQFTGKNR